MVNNMYAGWKSGYSINGEDFWMWIYPLYAQKLGVSDLKSELKEGLAPNYNESSVVKCFNIMRLWKCERNRGILSIHYPNNSLVQASWVLFEWIELDILLIYTDLKILSLHHAHITKIFQIWNVSLVSLRILKHLFFHYKILRFIKG